MDLACTDIDWNPIGAAPLHSQLAGMLASLVFAGMVLLLSTRFPGRGRRTNAMVLFAVSFLTLLTASFDFGVISGDQVCLRIWTMTMPAAGLLGVGVLGIFCGMSWLVDQFDDAHHAATRVVVATTRVVAVIVGFNLWTTADLYVRKIGPSADLPAWLSPVVNVSWWVVLALVVMQFVYAIARRRSKRVPREVSRRRVVVTAYAYLFCVVVASFLFGQTVVPPPDYWLAPDNDLLVIATLTSFGLPAMVLLLQLFALPLGKPETEDNTE